MGTSTARSASIISRCPSDRRTPPGAGALTGVSGKDAAEMTLVGEAASQRNLGERQIRPTEQGHGAFDPKREHPGVGGQTRRFTKCPGEIARRKTAGSRDLCERS
jgi:hypothetical protein